MIVGICILTAIAALSAILPLIIPISIGGFITR